MSSKNTKVETRRITLIFLMFFVIVTSIFTVYSITSKSNKISTYTAIPPLQARKAYYQKKFPNAKIIQNKSSFNKNIEKDSKQLQLTKELVLAFDNNDTNKIFFNLCDVKADSLGSIYVAEYSRSGSHIKKFDQNGNYLLTIGRTGDGPGEFAGPPKINIYGDTLFVFDSIAGRITFFNLKGHYLNSITLQMNMLNTPDCDFLWHSKSKRFYLSFYDRELDSVIHSFNPSGKKMGSFGNPLNIRKPLSFMDFELISKNSPGRLCIYDNKILFSQFNPYEVRMYSLQGDLKKVIFREADFMPRDAIKILPSGEYETGLPTISTMIKENNGFVLNFILVVPDAHKKYGTILDILSSKGQLFASTTLADNIWFSDLRPNGMLYGRKLSFDASEGESVVCYKIQFYDLF